MEDYLDNLEYYSNVHHCFVIGEIIDIDDEDNYIMKNKNDGTEEICESKNIRKITNISSTPLNEGNECIYEYIKNDEEFVEVEIKEQKGLFYILETVGEESTFLARQKQLRSIEYLSIEDYIQDKYANITLSMPSELINWINSERFNDVLQRIRGDSEKSDGCKLFYTCYPSEEPKYLRILCDADKKDLAKLLLSTAMEKEKKLSSLSQDTEKSKKQLENAQKQNQTVYIKQKYIGLIIGKDGVNIKNLKNKYNVNITIDSKKNDKKPTKVIITGDDGDKVDECAKEINVSEKIFELTELSESSVADLRKKGSKFIEDYKIKYFFISYEEKKDEEGNIYKAPNVTIIGNSEFIDALYNGEIKDYDKYNKNYGNNNYNYNSGSSYRQNNRRYNNNYNYYNNYNQENYKYNKSYSHYY